jgi:hypothetical protein
MKFVIVGDFLVVVVISAGIADPKEGKAAQFSSPTAEPLSFFILLKKLSSLGLDYINCKAFNLTEVQT